MYTVPILIVSSLITILIGSDSPSRFCTNVLAPLSSMIVSNALLVAIGKNFVNKVFSNALYMSLGCRVTFLQMRINCRNESCGTSEYNKLAST